MYGDIYVVTDRYIPEASFQAREIFLEISQREVEEEKVGREFKRKRICSTHLVRLEHRNWEFFCPVCETLMEY